MYMEVHMIRVYRVDLDDTVKLCWLCASDDEAEAVRDYCYKADEDARKNGEPVPYRRYIIIRDY